MLFEKYQAECVMKEIYLNSAILNLKGKYIGERDYLSITPVYKWMCMNKW